MMFVFLFGIIRGIASSAGVVTSAAVIMVAMFSIFVTMSLVDLKILGVGTAAAVLIDATIVRGILVPAALALLGNRAWRWRGRPRSLTGNQMVSYSGSRGSGVPGPG